MAPPKSQRPSSPLRSSFTASSASPGNSAFTSVGASYRPPSAIRPDSPALLFDHANELPPRRELPFQRSDSVPKSRGSETSRPSSRNLPPLPKPTFLDNIPPLVKPDVDMSIHSSPKKSSASNLANNRATGKRSHPSSAVLTRQDGFLFDIPRSSSSSSVVFDRPPSAISVTGEQQRSFDSQDRMPPSLSLDHLPESSFKPSTDTNSISSYKDTSLADYASRSDEDRANTINQTLLRYLENPDFLTLLGDIETAWVRIAPGHG